MGDLAVVESSRLHTIAVIDDNQIDLMMYKRLLARSGSFDNVLGFNQAHAALGYFAANPDDPVDVILLDINMPRMSGFEFLAAAQKQLATHIVDMVLMMLTTSLNLEDIEQARHFDSVKAYITKPLSPRIIEHVVKLVVARRTRDPASTAHGMQLIHETWQLEDDG